MWQFHLLMVVWKTLIRTLISSTDLSLRTPLGFCLGEENTRWGMSSFSCLIFTDLCMCSLIVFFPTTCCSLIYDGMLFYFFCSILKLFLCRTAVLCSSYSCQSLLKNSKMWSFRVVTDKIFVLTWLVLLRSIFPCLEESVPFHIGRERLYISPLQFMSISVLLVMHIDPFAHH